jgi:hypothetical protein
MDFLGFFSKYAIAATMGLIAGLLIFAVKSRAEKRKRK